MRFLFGVIVGIVISTVGFSGIAKIADNAVNKTKEVVEEQVKDK